MEIIVYSMQSPPLRHLSPKPLEPLGKGASEGVIDATRVRDPVASICQFDSRDWLCSLRYSSRERCR
eukprot:7906671-Pyramimonas_sp.AAC.1